MNNLSNANLTSSRSSISLEELSTEIDLSTSSEVIIPIDAVASTQSCCFVCGSKSGRSSIPWSAIRQVWFEKKIFIPKSNRTCTEHLSESKQFKDEVLLLIEASKEEINITSKDLSVWLHEICQLPKNQTYNFDNDGMESTYYKMFLGITKESFDDLVQYLPGTA